MGTKIHSLKTGCFHYHSPLDIVAIKFKCCGAYYACYLCHLALVNHPVERWKQEDLNKLAILCGHCGQELTIHQYLFGNNHCLHCSAPFNPKCKNHWERYFEEGLFFSRF